jgi:DNA-binding Lrp family transcriptional regulator
MQPTIEARLLNEFQRDFPLVREPFALIAHRLGLGAGDVMATLAARIDDGTVSRVGAVFRPGAIGVSTLAAMSVPAEDLDRVADCVSARPEVNHNYEREHALNLWFVAAAPDRLRLDAALAAIARDTGIAPISLPLVDDYAIDLGFDLSGAASHAKPPQPLARVRRRGPLSPADARLVAALDDGLPLVAEPYAAIARRAGVSQLYTITRLADWLRSGVLKRFGVVVRHRALGYVANAMCVWDVDDAHVAAIGAALAQEPAVTLCYRRARALPAWPYNLFCMIHGRDRASVLARLDGLSSAHGLDGHASAVLFSRRAFKQCGARYAIAPDATPLAA